MSYIKTLSVKNIRSHTDISVDFSPETTVITGKNGSGKTSLVEAIYIALQGSSFKGTDTEVLRHGSPWWRIDVVTDETARIVTFDPSRTSGKKRFEIDDKTMYRLTPQYKYPVVLFEPDDLRLLHGSPSRRRLFIDRFVSQINPGYGAALRKYERALKQRNNMLKKPIISQDELFIWNVALSEYGAHIIEQRTIFIEKINSQLSDIYHTIAHTDDVVSVHYSHTLIDGMQQKILAELHGSAERDRLLGYTSIGPHRHDVVFQYNNSPALSVASRGEVRSIVLALKFIEGEILEGLTGNKPIVLLDDVFSELDEERQGRLLEEREYQKIITSASIPEELELEKIFIKL